MDDTSAVLAGLSAAAAGAGDAATVLTFMQSIRGPYAFAFWQVTSWVGKGVRVVRRDGSGEVGHVSHRRTGERCGTVEILWGVEVWLSIAHSLTRARRPTTLAWTALFSLRLRRSFRLAVRASQVG